MIQRHILLNDWPGLSGVMNKWAGVDPPPRVRVRRGQDLRRPASRAQGHGGGATHSAHVEPGETSFSYFRETHAGEKASLVIIFIKIATLEKLILEKRQVLGIIFIKIATFEKLVKLVSEKS